MARLGTTRMVLGLAALAALPACDAAFESDGGAMAPADAGPDLGAGDGGPVAEGPEDPGFAGACYDERDNDRDGALDCAEEACATTPMCCVGSALEACCRQVEGDLTLSAPAACDGAPAAECAELPDGLTFFGEAARFERGGLVPQGDVGHVGVVLGGAVDPRRTNLELSADIAVPSAEMRCADCTDTVGIALIDEVPADGAPAAIRLGVLVNGPLEEVRILIADEVVQRLPMAPAEGTYRLALRVDGTATIDVPGHDAIALEGFELPETVHAAVLGRTDNRPAGEAAVAVTAASRSLRECDVPDALARREAPVMPAADVSWSAEALGRPSAALGGETERVWVAFERNGTLHMAGETGTGELRGAPLDPSDPVVDVPTDAPIVRLLDPWLMVDPEVTDRWLLFFAAEDQAGVRRVYRTGGDRGWGQAFDWPEAPILDPDAHEALASIDAPTVWRDAGGFWHLIARVTTAQGGEALALFDRNPEGRWLLRGGSLETARVAAPRRDDLFAFDRDAVGAPAVVVHGPETAPVWRLYYAGRRGTRWTIGALVSEDGSEWRRLGPVLGGRDGTAFDALGVTDPAPVRLDDGIRLYYRGTDGADSAFGVAGPSGTLPE
jgi:hypothetical protein